MSATKIPEQVKIRLWGKAAGRCQYEGCNKPLWLDSVTKAEFNTAYVAHIVGDKPDGPRGDSVLSSQLAIDITNLMLMCDEHHRLIDRKNDTGHPVERLVAMKTQHEARIEATTAIGPEMRSFILLYGANVGAQSSPLSYANAARAMSPERYPADARPISLGMKNSALTDDLNAFWKVESEQLSNMVAQQLRPRLSSGEINHLSVFALAPQPLLVLLGSLLSDIQSADVFQLRREPATWKWSDLPGDDRYSISVPKGKTGKIALVFALSATITDDRIFSVLGNDAAIWRFTIPSPHNDFLQAKNQTKAFRTQLRSLLDQIKSIHGEGHWIHIFPAMPVSCAVELGRVRMPKADLPWKIYDQNNKHRSFIEALSIGD